MSIVLIHDFFEMGCRVTKAGRAAYACVRHDSATETRPNVFHAIFMADFCDLITLEQEIPRKVRRENRSTNDDLVKSNILVLLHGQASDHRAKAVCNERRVATQRTVGELL